MRDTKKFEWACPKCSDVIKANSENTLEIDKVEHLKWHEIKDKN